MLEGSHWSVLPATQRSQASAIPSFGEMDKKQGSESLGDWPKSHSCQVVDTPSLDPTLSNSRMHALCLCCLPLGMVPSLCVDGEGLGQGMRDKEGGACQKAVARMNWL